MIADAIIVLAVAVLFSLSISIGEVPIPLPTVIDVLRGGGSTGQQFIIGELRLPRAVVTLAVGIALGISGAIVQTITRNPLASPDVIGILSGASAGAVAAIVIGGSASGSALAVFGVPAFAVVGGLLAAAVVFLLAWKQGIDGFRLILVGIGIGAICTALTSLLLVRARVHEASQAIVWLTGALDGRTWSHAWPLLIALAVVCPVLAVMLHAFGALGLGDQTARSIGIRVETVRTIALLCATVLASVAVAAAGPIAFVAFVAPQIMMRVIGSPAPPIFSSGLGGALLLLGTDVGTRALLPVGLPVGIVTVVLGSPFFLFLLLARRRRLTV